MQGFPSRRKPFDSASADSCEDAALSAECTLMFKVMALVLQAGNGGDVERSGAPDEVADPDGAEAADDGGGDVAAPAQGCGARAHIGGSKAPAPAALAGVAGERAGEVGLFFSTFTRTAVRGAGCPGNDHPSPSRKSTGVPCNFPSTTQVKVGPVVPAPAGGAEQTFGKLPPAACTTVERAAKVVGTLVLPVRHASALPPHPPSSTASAATAASTAAIPATLIFICESVMA